MSYEKWRNDKVYLEEIEKIKKQVDKDFVDHKWEELPETLTREKAQELVARKQGFVEAVIKRMIEGQQPNGQGQVMIGQKELVYQLAKFDDETYINEGLRKE
jgi:hypothetical protein